MKIVVAVDGSPNSKHAVQALAHLTPPEELVLVHALHLPDFNYALISPELRAEAQANMETKLRKEGEGILAQTLDQVPSDFPQAQTIHQVGHPVNVILETVRSSKSHLILLGARGLGQVKELVLGSVSHRILLHASCSTMIIKEPVARIKKVLLPVEGEEDITAALQFLALQPFREPVGVDVFAVWPQPQLAWPGTLGQSKLLEMHAIEEAQDRMKSVTEKLLRMNYTAEAKVGMGDPAFAILEQAHASQADLIVMGTHGRGGLARFLMGSVSHSVLHHANCPVLIVR